MLESKFAEYNKFMISSQLMAGIYKIQKEPVEKHPCSKRSDCADVPGQHCRRVSPGTGSISPQRHRALVMNQGPMWPLRQTLAAWAVSGPWLISPRKTENFPQNWWELKILLGQCSPTLILTSFGTKQAGHEQVGGRGQAHQSACDVYSTHYTLPNVPHFIQTAPNRFYVRLK